MKTLFSSVAVTLLLAGYVFAQDMVEVPVPIDRSTSEHIDMQILPFYLGEEKPLQAGAFSRGLASKDDKEFVATILKMKEKGTWESLSFPIVYIGAIQLYNMGYRKEAGYWMLTAQYRGKLFKKLADREKLGGIGSVGFELFQGQDAFSMELRETIMGFNYLDADRLAVAVKKVMEENKSVPDMKEIYPGVAFTDESQWKTANQQLNEGMTELLKQFQDKELMAQVVKENHLAETYGKVSNKDLPAR